MFIKESVVTCAFLFFTLIFAANCTKSSDTITFSMGDSQTNGGAMPQTPTPFTGKKASVRGEYADAKFLGNLKESIEQQGLPKIWLEFEKDGGEVTKLDLKDEYNSNLKSAGDALFQYQFVINNSENPSERGTAKYDQIIKYVEALNEIRRLEVDAPDGRRRLTEEEITALFSKQSGLINDRYFVLENHFKPKSAFEKLKESVSEKLNRAFF